MPLLQLDRATTRPWGRTLLDGIELELHAGEIIGIIGPNGAGKSSLLRLICGELPLSDGGIDFCDSPLSQWSPRLRAQLLAVLPQQSVLEFPFTVEEVVRLGRTAHSSGRRVDNDIVDTVLDQVDMVSLRHRPYTQLSGGERQRTQLARVFAQIWQGGQRLLLLDEPTSALDLAHQQQLMATLQHLAADGCAVMMVVHDVNLLSASADRLLALHRGRVRALGTPEAVLSETLFQDLFDAQVRIERHPVHHYPVVLPP